MDVSLSVHEGNINGTSVRRLLLRTPWLSELHVILKDSLGNKMLQKHVTPTLMNIRMIGQKDAISGAHLTQGKEKGQQQFTWIKPHLSHIWKSLAYIRYCSSACQVVNTITRSPSSLMLIIVCSFKVFFVVLLLFTSADKTPTKLNSPVLACLDQSKCPVVYTKVVEEAKVSVSYHEGYF